MSSIRFTWYVAFIALLRLGVCAGQGELSPNLDPPHFAQLKGPTAVRRSPSQGFSPRYLFARSPIPQSGCYSCEDSNGTPGCVAQGSDCCPGGGVCGPSQQCCWGKCISRTTDQCCNTPGTVCSNGYQCILMRYISRFQNYQYPTCCTDTSCENEDTLYVIDGYERPTRPPPPPTSTQVVYQTYTRTVTWTYYYFYYIYIEVRRTTLLTSERLTTVRVISVTATNSAEAEAELSASAEVLSLETPPQPTTEFRGPTPPPSTTSQEPEPTTTSSEEPTTPPPTTTRAPESDPVDSLGPDPSEVPDTPPPFTISRSRTPTSSSNSLPDFELPEPTVNATDSDTTFPTGQGGSGSSAALSRFEGLTGFGGGVMIVTFLFALVVAVL